MQDGDSAAHKPLPRGLLTKIRDLAFSSPLCKRLAANLPPAPAAATVRPGDLRALTPERALAMVESLAPDPAWRFYAELPLTLQEFVAAKCTTSRWGELLMREMRERARESASASRMPAAGRVHAAYFEFKQMTLACRACRWTGLGADCAVGEMFEGGQLTEYQCPQCSADIGLATWPTLDEYRANWATLSKLEREYVFRIEQAQENRESKPAH